MSKKKPVPYWQTEAGKEAHRKSNLKRLYNITPERFAELLVAQEGKCPICNRHKDEFVKPFVVDHHHVTMKVRGLICPACNTAIGLLGDSPEIMERAAEYVRAGGTDASPNAVAKRT